MDALLELTDNAVDDRVNGRLLEIEISLSRKRIRVENKGGRAMGLKELRTFLKWGVSEKRGRLGRYGQGGKAAMGYLGRSWSIFTIAEGQPYGWSIVEPNWQDRSKGLKQYSPREVKTPTGEPAPVGAVSIEITNLDRSLNTPAVIRRLGEVYRPLILGRKVSIRVNRRVVPPTSFPLRDTRDFERSLPCGERVVGWIGRLDPGTSKQRTGLRGGIRCYAYGRLICDQEFFGHPDPSYKASLNSLIGEVHAEFVPLNMNKTNFDRGSSAWHELEEALFEELKGDVAELLKAKDEPLTKKEERAAREARDILDRVLRRLARTEHLSGAFGETIGQKAPEPRPEPAGPKREPEGSRPPYQPATPAPSGAIGRRRRTGRLAAIELTNGDEYTRSSKLSEDGTYRILINRNFPAYRVRKNKLLYILETAIVELAKSEDPAQRSASEYVAEMNDLLRETSKDIIAERHGRSPI